MNQRDLIWLRISGVCGVITPLVAFTCILLAIHYSPEFSWTDNALSNLGIQKGLTAPLFNYGLITSGLFALAFAIGLFHSLSKKTLAKIGTFTFVLATLALIAIGIFPENIKPLHYYASVAFFALLPLALLVLVAAFLQMGKMKMGLFTLTIALVAAGPWGVYFAVQYAPNVAIPETISALSASTWAIVLGNNMLKQASQSRS